MSTAKKCRRNTIIASVMTLGIVGSIAMFCCISAAGYAKRPRAVYCAVEENTTIKKIESDFKSGSRSTGYALMDGLVTRDGDSVVAHYTGGIEGVTYTGGDFPDFYLSAARLYGIKVLMTIEADDSAQFLAIWEEIQTLYSSYTDIIAGLAVKNLAAEDASHLLTRLKERVILFSDAYAPETLVDLPLGRDDVVLYSARPDSKTAKQIKSALNPRTVIWYIEGKRIFKL